MRKTKKDYNEDKEAINEEWEQLSIFDILEEKD